jgi:hypothetical protein
MMPRRARSRVATAALLLIAAGGTVSVPREAHAVKGGVFSQLLPLSKWAYNICDFFEGTFWKCLKTAIRVDPVGDVTSVGLTLQYDPSRYRFNAAESGPLGVFSVGGSAPPATPGTGTQPLPIFSSRQETPGAPLPGSTLSMTDLGNAVAVDYDLASPLNVASETNFLVLVFDYVQPVLINAAQSTVTYSALTPGADFTESATVCTTGDPLFPTCGSDTPAMGVTIHLSGVPEPSALALFGSGLLVAAVVGRRRRSGTSAARRHT